MPQGGAPTDSREPAHAIRPKGTVRAVSRVGTNGSEEKLTPRLGMVKLLLTSPQAIRPTSKRGTTLREPCELVGSENRIGSVSRPRLVNMRYLDKMGIIFAHIFLGWCPIARIGLHRTCADSI